MKNVNTTYENLNIDIPTRNRVMVEKYVAPFYVSENLTAPRLYIEWRDKNEELHSFNGFPSIIKINKNVDFIFKWHKHGEKIRTLRIEKKSPESEIIANKIATRNFEERAKKKR